MSNAYGWITKTFTFNVGKMEISPTYWQAITIVFLIFLLLFTLARVRYLYVHWSMGQSAIAFLFWGFLLAMIFEAFMIVGGRTLFTELVGIENLPKPISTVLDLGRARLAKALGDTVSPVPGSYASEKPTVDKVLSDYSDLSPEEASQAQDLICKPAQ